MATDISRGSMAYSILTDPEKDLDENDDFNAETNQLVAEDSDLKKSKELSQKFMWAFSGNALLFFVNIIFLAILVFHPGQSLLETQKHCGRLLGQWRGLLSETLLQTYELTFAQSWIGRAG